MSTPIIFVITSFLGPALRFKLFMFLFRVVLGFGVDIDYTGPEIDDEMSSLFNIHHKVYLKKNT